MNRILFVIVLGLLVSAETLFARQVHPKSDRGGVYIDKKGVMRWKSNGSEAAFFGVNYTVPFAYGYRSHKTLGVDHKKAVDQDVYHLARLGLNAFRVHVWDTEISDSLGNLKENEHLHLFDYLIAKLEERGIYSLITPIAFWGNGYPDPDEKTGSFSELYGKDRALREERAFAAQERYLKQFFNHVNPYTGKRYGDDPWVIAAEINNEPHHSGPKTVTTGYINRMAAAIRSTGWSKPVFYNISESPAYADAVVASNANGFSFQWYPTGLVSGHELKGNFLPNVDRYVVPFDTIPGFRGKPLMVYEFDAGDVMQPVMYPAMARSFRAAGFQWATQFAYDPLATAYANTEYQTHYLNLAYTPAKAISLLIAGKVFRQLPLRQSFGKYPADSVFGDFRVSYTEQLSEMNSKEEYYYSNTTLNPPRQPGALKHIAGTGSSPVVQYSGNGAYFMDKLADGVWRLEVMPDVVEIRDPFDRTSLDRKVRKIVRREQSFHIRLADLGAAFRLRGLNKGNSFTGKAVSGSFRAMPGTYLLEKEGKKSLTVSQEDRAGYIGLSEFVAPDEKESPEVSSNEDKLLLAPKSGSFSLYNPGADQNLFVVYPGVWGKNKYEYLKNSSGQTALRLQHEQQEPAGFAAVEVYLNGSKSRHLSLNDTVIVNVAPSVKITLKVTLVDADGAGFSTVANLNAGDVQARLPLSSFRSDSIVLLPRPYPGFQPLHFIAGKKGMPDLKRIEKMQLSYPVKDNTAFSVIINSVGLKQSDH